MHDSELIIRAKREQKVYELLPVHALQGDFPQAFVNDYAHWLDVNTGFIEWRPLLNAWTSTSQNWQMQSGSRDENFLLCGSSRLIDLHTPTAKAVSAVLSPLEDAIHIHVILNCEKEVLEVHLPRLKLDFLLRKGASQLESKQFRGMAVDANQSFGTLTGLVNKLVLRGITDRRAASLSPTVTFCLSQAITTYVYISTCQHNTFRIIFIILTLKSGDFSTTAVLGASYSNVIFTP